MPLEDKEKISIAEEKIRDELKDEALEFNSDSFPSESQSDNEKKNIKNDENEKPTVGKKRKTRKVKKGKKTKKSKKSRKYKK